MEQLEQVYINILRRELVPAQGCTEPIALAYCAAKARWLLGCLPERIRVQASGNIIKNVKSVVVPGTGGRKGIEVAAVFGAIAGDADKELEVLSGIDDHGRAAALAFLEHPQGCTVEHLKTEAKLHIIVTVYSGKDWAEVEIRDRHTNIVRMERSTGPVYQSQDAPDSQQESTPEDTLLNIRQILQFAREVPLEKIQGILDRQIQYNSLISQEGLSHAYGANIGRTLLETFQGDLWAEVKAAAAAGSDARMSGSLLPVVINSGSGNQGITASMPVIAYARAVGASHEQLIRALAVSNLVAIHQKTKIGRLSAYCGAVSAAAGSGAGIAWLDGAPEDIIELTISNTLANVSGILCDGAKPSCAAKIASAVDAALMGYALAKKRRSFQPGDGIVKDTLEQTISGVGDVASKGMVQTDEEIIHLMISH